VTNVFTRLYWLYYLWRHGAESYLNKRMTPAGWQLYQALQQPDGWTMTDFKMTLGGMHWWIANGESHLKLHNPDIDVLSDFDKRVCWVEIARLRNKIAAAHMIRAMAGVV